MPTLLGKTPMTVFVIAGVALVCLAGGAALAWFVLRGREGAASDISSALTAEAIPFSASTDEIADSVGVAFAGHTELQLLGLYAGREEAGVLDAWWRAADTGASRAPLHAPATLVLQLQGAQLVDPEELSRGLRPGLPPADPTTEARQIEAERQAEQERAAAAFSDNPFEIEDGALTDSAMPVVPVVYAPVAPTVDEAALAARLVAVPWSGPFGWRGLLVARPLGPDRARDLAWASRAASRVGERLGVHCEVVDRRREAAIEPSPPPNPIILAVPAPERVAIEPSPAAARLRRAEIRMAEALQAPRREPDLIRSVVVLLAEGLATDRCYAVEAEGLHTRPVEHERRSEAAAAATGLDFSRGFLDAVRERSGPTTKAVTLDASHAAEMVPDDARARLGPVSRMLLPVLEKGRIVVVFVAEWIDLAKRWTDDDVLFAERVVTRAAVARERLLQYEAIAEQAAHARASQEEVEQALGQLQAVLAALPEAVVGLDDEGKVTFANPAAGRLLGRREFELMGRYMTEVTIELEADVETWERVMAADSTRRFPGALAPSDGRRTIDLTVVPGLPSGVCDRLVTLSERAGPSIASSNGDGDAGAVVREIAEPLGRLLGNLELLAGGAYGHLSTGQSEALEGVCRLGADLRAHIDDVLREKA